MPARTYDILEAGVGARVRLATKTDKRQGTIVGIRFNRRSHGITVTIQFDDGQVSGWWRPKNLTLLGKSPLYVEHDGGRTWRVYGVQRYVDTALNGVIYKADKVVGWKDGSDFDPIYADDGYHVYPQGRKLDVPPVAKFPTFWDALTYIKREYADARPAIHAQEPAALRQQEAGECAA